MFLNNPKLINCKINCKLKDQKREQDQEPTCHWTFIYIIKSDNKRLFQ